VYKLTRIVSKALFWEDPAQPKIILEEKAAMGSSRTVLYVENGWRTKNRGLGLIDLALALYMLSLSPSVREGQLKTVCTSMPFSVTTFNLIVHVAAVGC